MFVAPRAPSPLRALALLLLAALVVRILVFSAVCAPEHALAPLAAAELSGDARLYHTWAAELAAGRDPYAGVAWWHPPLFPLVLGRIYALCGPDPRAALALQIVCGLFALGFLYLWVRRVLGARAALAAGLFSVLYLPSVFFETRLLPAPLATALTSVALWCAARAGDARHPRRLLAAAGLAAGLAALARPNLLPFAPALALACAWRPPQGCARGRALLAVLLGIALPLGASAARNAAQGDAVLICANGGVNLWIANAEQASPFFRAPDARWTRIETQEEEARAEASEALGHSASASETSRHFASRALEERAADPLATLALLGRKLLAAVSDVEAGVFDLPQIERELAPSLWVAPLPFALLLALAVLGAFQLTPEERRRLLPAALLWACGLLVGLAFFSYSRLRLPTLPVLFALAGVAATRGAPRFALRAGACAAAALVASWPDWEGLLATRRSKIYVEQALRRARATPPPEQHELARLAARVDALRASEAENELLLAAAAELADRRGDSAARDAAVRELARVLPARSGDALSDALRLSIARYATGGLEASLRGPGPAPAEPLLALPALALLEALQRGAREESARAALDLRLGYLLAKSQVGGDPAATLDRALTTLHAALRHVPSDEREARELTGPALYFRGGTYDQIAALPARRAQRDQLLALALRDYHQAVQVLHGEPPQRALELAGPALALGFLGKERAARGVEEGQSASRLADRVLEARRAAGYR
ncbi:MAG: glycosyltransferase family 39 protein [Planctomycetes bacterium]|nr:glycosyltransferase family 39 protein [Planctomycetota bacterium]